jgi:hypothetical protein
MIYHQTKCPLCGGDLEYQTFVFDDGAESKHYLCHQKVKIYPDFNGNTETSHYDYNEYIAGFGGTRHHRLYDRTCEMIIMPYHLEHRMIDCESYTAVFLLDVTDKLGKFLFNIPTLDMDWSQPHLVVERLKLLTTFS